MEILSVKNLSFKYPASETLALDNISLTINEGEFVVIIGLSGSGKTTLLKNLKPEFAPHGDITGEITIVDKPINSLNALESAQLAGYLSQHIEDQIVTENALHELCFGMENLRFSTDSMRLRASELSAFFGLKKLLDKNTHELSGGEKQLLSIASVLCTSPRLLLLDEPTSGLDPIARRELVGLLKRLSDETSLTVIMTAHELDDVLTSADRIIAIENGRISVDKPTKQAVTELLKHEALCLNLPTYSRISELGEPCLSVREARAAFTKLEKQPFIKADTPYDSESIIKAKGVCFRYNKKEKDVLFDLSFSISKGSITALTGENGCGKSTLLKCIAGTLNPYSGKIKKAYEAALLPQNPRLIFKKDTIIQELNSLSSAEKVNSIVKKFGIEHIAGKHPYDVSGGELQRAALAKLLLKKPKILLLDEPTSSLDNHTKQILGGLLKELANEGITIVMSTHDIDFIADYCTHAAMMFMGEITVHCDIRKYFAGNSYFTSSANRIARSYDNCIINLADIRSILK